MQLLSILALSIALAFSTTASAHSFTVGDLRIGHPFARTTVPGQASGAVYLTLENTGKNTDKLVAVSTPIARTAELHSMSMDGNVMKMREVRNMEIKPAAKLAIMPGDGYHIMLTGLKQPLKAGDKFPLTLTFEKAGKLEISVMVEDKEAKAKEADAPAHSHQHH